VLSVCSEVVGRSLRDETDDREGHPEKLDLSGVDLIVGHLNIRLVYFFKRPLPAPALKASLAEVSSNLFVASTITCGGGCQRWGMSRSTRR
jgi:hypothetical protein